MTDRRALSLMLSDVFVIATAVSLLSGYPEFAQGQTGPPGGLFDNFAAPQLNPAKWLIVEKNWGGQVAGVDYNGGVVAENVLIKNGRLHLFANGNAYVGP